MLFPGTTLFNKAFTYRKQQIPAADGRPARDVIHPNETYKETHEMFPAPKTT